MPALLLDAHLSHALATALRAYGYDALHVAVWREGQYRTADDGTLLSAAATDQRVLMTQDTATVPLAAYQLLADGAPCAGVIVLSSRVRQTDIGGQLAALLEELKRRAERDWAGAVVHVGRR